MTETSSRYKSQSEKSLESQSHKDHSKSKPSKQEKFLKPIKRSENSLKSNPPDPTEEKSPPLKAQQEKCEDCSFPATYICVCEEEKLCEECLVSHVKDDSSLKHRIVSLFHPLVSLFETSEDEGEEDEVDKIQEQIEALKEFRDKCVDLIDSKIKSIHCEGETPGPSKLFAPGNNKSFTPIPVNLQSSFRSARPEISVRESKFPGRKSFDSNFVPGSICRINHFSSFECFSYKVLITGGVKVGKSCVIESFKQIHADFNESSVMVFNSILCENLKVSLEVFEDRAVEGCSLCLGSLVVFDLTNKDSFEYAKGLIKLLESNATVLNVVILVGTKLDLIVSGGVRRFASFAAIQNFAMSRGVLYDEISAVNYSHVQELFMRLVRELYKKSNS
jgi:hypothetical protein